MLMVTLDWVLVYDLVALFAGIILGVSLISSHHRMHVSMDGDD
jgi:hypothetical protein